jgi:hypothetical protein
VCCSRLPPDAYFDSGQDMAYNGMLPPGMYAETDATVGQRQVRPIVAAGAPVGVAARRIRAVVAACALARAAVGHVRRHGRQSQLMSQFNMNAQCWRHANVAIRIERPVVVGADPFEVAISCVRPVVAAGALVWVAD